MPTFKAEVDVDLEDILEGMTDQEILDDVEAFLRRRQSKLSLDQAMVGDPEPAHYVERAYLAAKAMTSCPTEIIDMFWHVHGRAIA